ncbi:uncharacterized protein LOC120208995 [Hibiscus syriacus]|uniref:uncharacterized protein LOC120208995 n=1 Tax=Hibiscus syriacus TaxID=106335 RepID=UPI0019214B60|nr:uncharacterized protein LOC120208995 [Hibiscus syriacus]
MSFDGNENAINVQTWSEYGKTWFGDNIATTKESVFLEKVIISVKQAHWSELSRIWARWDDNEKILFREVYSDIVELLRVSIDAVVVRVLAECWNPAYRCFTFGKVDMTPTLEEYTTPLNIPNIRRHSLYTKAIRPKGFTTKMITLTGKTKEWVKEYIHDERISWAQLKSLIYEQTQSKRRRDHFALAVYGLVVFPWKEDHFDIALIDFVEVISRKTNPAPTIIAKTFLSLNQCRRSGESDFSPLVDFLDKFQISEHRKRKDWVEALRNIKDTEIVWKAYWLPKEDILYRCGNNSFLMLHELWGAVGYTPLIAL